MCSIAVHEVEVTLFFSGDVEAGRRHGSDALDSNPRKLTRFRAWLAAQKLGGYPELEAAPNRMEMQTGRVRAAELEYEAISVRTGFGRTSGGSAFMDVSVEGGISRGPHRHTVSPAIDELEAWRPIGLRERSAHLAANTRVRITEGEGRWIAQPAGGALAGIAA